MRRARTATAPRVILFVVGPPGVGKTTTMRALLGFPEVYTIVKPKWTITNDRSTCAAGHYAGETFDGADQVPYNGVLAALDYWKRYLAGTARLTLFDGDRFSNRGTVEQLRAMGGFSVRCVHLDAPEDVLQARRTERGSNQDATWLKGRVTKASNFASLFKGPELLYLQATDPTADLTARVRAYVST